MRSNPHFVYTVLVRKDLFAPLRSHARFAYEVENIFLVRPSPSGVFSCDIPFRGLN